MLPGDGDLRGLDLGERHLLPKHGLPLHLQQVSGDQYPAS